MKLCMFSPRDLELERGWPGRIDGDRVIQLAAQTLQSFFTGGGNAREHAEYPLEDVQLRAPVLHPPSVRVFGGDGDFAFANPATIFGPDEEIALPPGAGYIESDLRIAAVIGADGAVGGYTLVNDWIAPELTGAKARDFATSLGPVVITLDEFPSGGDWTPLVEHAGRGTRLYPGDIIAAGTMRDGPYVPGDVVELEFAGIGVLRNRVVRP
ncbi:MAG TPA: fumarylacetoacetate hydrolase family protein [Gaiellaceae bacterium]|nr:fumarylacetoacetate hydrolase family protein [Gaiellaceae bacterium]